MSEGAPENNTGPDGGAGSGAEDWKARFDALGGTDAEKWKEFSRKNETDLKKWQKEAERNAAAAKELADLRAAGQSETEKYTSLKSQFDSLNGEHQTAAQERESLAKENARLKAGMANGLSLEDMRFIPDGTPEEMTAAAKDLAERLGSSRAPDFDGGARRTAGAPQSMSDVIREQRSRMRGR
jgi:hypothetical protein